MNRDGKSRYSRLPVSLSDLEVHLDAENYGIDVVPVDPWGEAFVYELREEGGRGPKFALRSKGPDKVVGTDDDVFL